MKYSFKSIGIQAGRNLVEIISNTFQDHLARDFTSIRTTHPISYRKEENRLVFTQLNNALKLAIPKDIPVDKDQVFIIGA
jgi:hypothetical protein